MKFEMPPQDGESRRRRTEYDRDRERDITRPKDKAKRRHRTSHSDPRRSPKDKNRSEPDLVHSSSSSSYNRSRNNVSTGVPELDRVSRSTLPYPNFSKTHSRETVGSRENVNSTGSRNSTYTPDPTDLAPRTSEQDASPGAGLTGTGAAAAPPSPPLTADYNDLNRASSRGSMKQAADNAKAQMHQGRKSVDHTKTQQRGPRFSASRSSLRDAEEGRSSRAASYEREVPVGKPPSPTPKQGQSAHPEKKQSNRDSPLRKKMQTRNASGSQRGSQRGSIVSQSVTDSDATAVAPDRPQKNKIPTFPVRDTDSSHTVQGLRRPSRIYEDDDENPIIEVFTSNVSGSDAGIDNVQGPGDMLPPPPPPPPPMPYGTEAMQIPNVDYLLQNGGLSHTIPKTFSTAAIQASSHSGDSKLESDAFASKNPGSVFGPFSGLLDDINSVIAGNGSIAVATGYRSRARYLLERLEAVFSRNISSEMCPCIMCRSEREKNSSSNLDAGVSWGEVLELISGSKVLPIWPPFSLASATGTDFSELDHPVPMQKLDIDVPEEFRDHYIKQSKKTKQSVQNWLASQPEDNVAPPQEVDDETLTFAMLTYLEPEQRRIFTALRRELPFLPDPRAPTPANPEPKSDFMLKIGIALQRLYRLPRPPREPESSMYLLRNPSLHGALMTLAALSPAEWEILTSGRFSGFLSEGAEEQFPSMSTSSYPAPPRGGLRNFGLTNPSRAPSAAFDKTPLSRTTTPFSAVGGVPISRGPTPFRGRDNFGTNSVGAPLNVGTPTSSSASAQANPGATQVDEENEVAVLAEIEREIFVGMEALEDAFEALHTKAEMVRRALRERGAGLAMKRRLEGRPKPGPNGTPALGNGEWSEEEDLVRMGTPASYAGDGWNSEPEFNDSQWNATGDLNYSGMPGPPPPPPPPPIPGTTRWGMESEDGLGVFDERSELAPDDSASMVGYKEREKRRHRRTRRSRRTPAPVEEEDE